VMLAVFAIVSMLLAALGIHGVVSYGVAQRTREFGLRMALGAAPSQLRALVVASGLKTAGIGLLIGLAMGAALAPLLGSLLYGVRAIDPAVIGAVAALLLIVAVVSNYIPARRATRVDPMEALRVE